MGRSFASRGFATQHISRQIPIRALVPSEVLAPIVLKIILGSTENGLQRVGVRQSIVETTQLSLQIRQMQVVHFDIAVILRNRLLASTSALSLCFATLDFFVQLGDLLFDRIHDFLSFFLMLISRHYNNILRALLGWLPQTLGRKALYVRFFFVLIRAFHPLLDLLPCLGHLTVILLKVKIATKVFTAMIDSLLESHCLIVSLNRCSFFL